MKRRTEQRTLALDLVGLEVRAEDANAAPQLVGHAAVFNQWSRIADPFMGELWDEQVAPGAFRKTIKEGDVRALWNHDPNIVLGRNKAGTLSMAEDDHGLSVTITPPDNEWGRPVMDAIKRGDVSGMSIAFQVVKDAWENPDRKADPQGVRKRTIREARLLDVSPVTYPAFPQTDISARSEMFGDDDGLLRALKVLRLADMGAPIEAEDRAVLRATAAILQRHAEAGEPEAQADHSPTPEPVARANHSVEELRRELELCEMTLRLGGYYEVG